MPRHLLGGFLRPSGGAETRAALSARSCQCRGCWSPCPLLPSSSWSSRTCCWDPSIRHRPGEWLASAPLELLYNRDGETPGSAAPCCPQPRRQNYSSEVRKAKQACGEADALSARPRGASTGLSGPWDTEGVFLWTSGDTEQGCCQVWQGGGVSSRLETGWYLQEPSEMVVLSTQKGPTGRRERGEGKTG